MGEWQPIETAPKDQTWVIAYDPGAVAPQQFVSRWVEWESPPGEPDIDGEWLTEDDKSLPSPTHWMPLSAPPPRAEG